ncbi:MAG TPA: hypothetical protein VJ902_07860 [Wenzhouxiangellaceae bacterium]|nr:hypothetical protein [Wenzhouxiangellaceae bacterium]
MNPLRIVQNSLLALTFLLLVGCASESEPAGGPSKFVIDVMDVDTGQRLAMARVAGDGVFDVVKDGVEYRVAFTPRNDDPNVLQITLGKSGDAGSEHIDATGISMDPSTVYTNIPSQLQISASIWPPPGSSSEE